MIKQKKITIKTDDAILTYAEMGDIVCNSENKIKITLPPPNYGLWYRISNVGTQKVTIYFEDVLTTLMQAEQCLCLANSNSEWFVSKGGGALPDFMEQADGGIAIYDSELKENIVSFIGQYSKETFGVSISLESAGYSDGNYSKIFVNEVDVSQNKTGMNLVLIRNGEIVESINFNTHQSATNQNNLANYINGLYEGDLIVVSVKDQASLDQTNGGVTPELQLAFETRLFSTEISNLKWRDSYGIISTVDVKKHTEIKKSAGSGVVFLEYNIESSEDKYGIKHSYNDHYDNPIFKFVDLDDVPSVYTDMAGKVVKVKPTEDGLEFGEGSFAKNGIGIIPITGWVVNEGDYGYKVDILINDIVDTDVLSLVIDANQQDVASDCELCPTVDSYNGGVTVYAKNVPTEEINFEYNSIVGLSGGSSGEADDTPTGTGRIDKFTDTLVASGASYSGICAVIEILEDIWISGITYYLGSVTDNNVTINFRTYGSELKSRKTGVTLTSGQWNDIIFENPIHLFTGSYYVIEILYSSGNKSLYRKTSTLYSGILWKMLKSRINNFFGTEYNETPGIGLIEYKLI